MHKTSEKTFEKQVIEAYKRFSWNKLHLRKDGALDSHKKKENLALYARLKRDYPGACPTFEYFKFMARAKIFYHDPVDTFLNSYVCPICKARPIIGMTNAGRNGNYKGKTCRSVECATELRKRTNLEKGGSTCALHRKDVKPKVEASFQKNWGVKYAGQSEEIRKKWQRTNEKKTGHKFQFQNPEVQKKVHNTWEHKSEQELRDIYRRRGKTLASPESQRLRYNTLKVNGTFNTSSDEEIIYGLLSLIYKKVDRQYKDEELYPFPCDFYIPKTKHFIEYQGYFTHGKEPYTGTDEQKEIVRKWKKKEGRLYKVGVRVWTKKDPLKRKTARDNDLNWSEFFNMQEFLDWFIKERNRKVISSLKSFLRKNNIPFSYSKKKRLFKITDTYFIQVVIPEANSMKIPSIGVGEVHKSYYHDKQKSYESKGIFCNFIRTYEWLDARKRKILKSNILHSVGKTPTVVYARDCEVVKLENKKTKQFQLDNCFYGYRKSSNLCLGLKLKKDKGDLHKGDLVEIMTFGLNYFGHKGKTEVHRVGTLNGCQVVGGMSRLLNHFFKETGKKELVYYLDWCHHSGMSLTEDKGFFLQKTAPSFHNYFLNTMEMVGRRPSSHAEMMRNIASKKAISVPIVGTKTYIIKNTQRVKIERGEEKPQ